MRVLVLALASIALCGCGDGRIERALNTAAATYPPPVAYASHERCTSGWDADEQEDRLRMIQTQMEVLQAFHPELF